MICGKCRQAIDKDTGDMPIFNMEYTKYIRVCDACYDAIYRRIQADIDRYRAMLINETLDTLICGGADLVPHTRKGAF
jgi:hypothetical protein